MTTLWILSCTFWRWLDGRDFSPKGWNTVLFVGLLAFCLHHFGYSTWQDVALALWVYGWTLVNVLCGYEMFTQSWVDNGFKRLPVHGWHEWDMWSRFALPAFIAVIPLLVNDLYNPAPWLYVLSCVPVGLLFPWWDKLGFKYRHPIREAILGAVVIGGLSWL